jgi:hypothetical protein
MKPVKPEDYRVDIGRGDGGKTFMRVVHLPSGISRAVESIGDQGMEWARKLTAEIQEELEATGKSGDEKGRGR